jgi:hypothetical protein
MLSDLSDARDKINQEKCHFKVDIWQFKSCSSRQYFPVFQHVNDTALAPPEYDRLIKPSTAGIVREFPTTFFRAFANL